MLSTTADYALRALLLLGRRRGEGPVRADEIAEAIGAPQNYLAKTLNALAKAGLVSSSRGPAGGFVLTVPPSAISLAQIIDCFEEPRPHTRCLLGNRPCNRDEPCSAHARWTEIRHDQRMSFTSTSLADLLGAA
jgi:Rrf2 family protein